MSIRIILCALLALTGCSRGASVMPDSKDATGTIVCTLKGEAYFARSGVGDTSFLIRQTEADRLCAKSGSPT